MELEAIDSVSSNFRSTMTNDTHMDFDLAIPFSKFLLLLWRNVLVTEKDDASLGDQKAKLVLLLVGKIFQLQTDDLRSNMGRQMYDFLRRGQQCFLLRICSGTWIYMWTIVLPDIVDIV